MKNDDRPVPKRYGNTRFNLPWDRIDEGPPAGKKATRLRVDQWIGLVLKLFKRGKK